MPCFIRIFSLVGFFAFLLSGNSPVLIGNSYGEENSSAPNKRYVRDDRKNAAIPQMQLEMQESLKKIPWENLSVMDKAKIRRLIGKVPVFRKMPKQTAYADPEMYSFLLEHPDVVIGFWQALGATQLSLKEIRRDTYKLREASGTEAVVEVLFRSRNVCIVYAKGEYRGSFLTKPYSGEVLLILQSKTERDQSGEPMVTCELDSFVSLDNLGADMLAKMFYSSLGKVADDNFAQTVAFLSYFSKTAAKTPEGLKGTAKKMNQIPQERCGELCEVIDRTALRYARRNAVRPENSYDLSEKRLETSQRGKTEYALRKKEIAEDKPGSASEIDELTIKTKSVASVFDSDPFFSGQYGRVAKQQIVQKPAPKTASQPIPKAASPPDDDDEPLPVTDTADTDTKELDFDNLFQE